MQKDIEVPLSVLVEVSEIIIEYEIAHEIVAGDESSETVTLTLTYEKDERQVIHRIEDLVEDYKEAG